MNKYFEFCAHHLLMELLGKEDNEQIKMWLGQIGKDVDLEILQDASKQLFNLCLAEIKRREQELDASS